MMKLRIHILLAVGLLTWTCGLCAQSSQKHRISARHSPATFTQTTDDPQKVPTLAEVSFVQFVGINDGHPLPQLANVAEQYEGKLFGDSAWANAIGERVRDVFQEQGFFKAKVMPSFEITKSPGTIPEVSVILNIDKGMQYRLKEIEIVGAKAFPAAQLRPRLLLNPGEIFDVANIRFGLESLRQLYGKKGYINFTPVPDTTVNADSTVSLRIDIEEGREFHIGEVRILGLPEEKTKELLQNLPKNGDSYDSDQLEGWVEASRSDFPVELRTRGADQLFELSKDEKNATVNLTIDLRVHN